MLSLAAIHTAVYEFLAAELAPVAVLTAGHNKTFPYVTLGNLSGDQSDLLNEEARDYELVAQAYSRQPSYIEVCNLLETVEAALNRKKFALPNGVQWVDTIFNQVQVFDELDGVTRRGLLRFRILTFKP
jgi:hypothetical protein